MNNNKYHHLFEAVDFCARRTKKFTVDEARLVAAAMKLNEPENPSQWSNVMRGAIAQGRIEMLPCWRKSNLNKTNGVPRRFYRLKKR
tara:strand:- start:857 stop:1117 length:261 start_codon:yes stop_codon:yes gene_type:complete